MCCGFREYANVVAEQLASGRRVRPKTSTEFFIEDLYRSSPLHDIGKVGVPDSILLKPGQADGERIRDR